MSFVLVALALVGVGCGGRQWPTVEGVADPVFVSNQSAVQTVDLLPIDVQVWTYPGSRYNPEAVSAALDQMIESRVQAELAERGYAVIAAMDWNGEYPASPGHRQSALTRDQVVATTLSLSTYGAAQAQSPGMLLVPNLPARLGEQTGTDATLYIGGWAYAGKEHHGMSTGQKIAVGIGIAVLAVVVVALIVAGGKGGGGGGGAAKVAGAVGKGLGTVAKGVVKVAGGLGRAAPHLISATAKGIVRTGITIGRYGPRIALDTLDAFGRAGIDTHIEVQPYRVDYYESPRTPHKGPPSMYLEMTLVDNRDGHTLWHARRRFPANPRKARDVAKSIHRLMASLP